MFQNFIPPTAGSVNRQLIARLVAIIVMGMLLAGHGAAAQAPQRRQGAFPPRQDPASNLMPPPSPMPDVPEATEVGTGSDMAPERMTIDEAVRRAEEVSPDLAEAKLEIDRMTRRLHGVRLRYYPRFRVTAEIPRATDYRVERDDRPLPTFEFDSSEPAAAVSFSQHLPTNTDLEASYSHGVNRNGLLDDRVTLYLAQEILQRDPDRLDMNLFQRQVWLQRVADLAVQREFRYRVVGGYLDVVAARQRLINAKRRFDVDREFAEESERKYESGIIAEYAVLDYRRDFEKSRDQQVQSRAAYQRSRNNLLLLLQLPLGSEIEFTEPGEPVVDSGLVDPARMVDAALRTSLDIAELRYNLFANDENISYLRNSLLPSVKLFTSFDQRSSLDEIAPVPEIEYTELTAGLLISVPLFGERLETGNNIALERIDRQISKLEFEDSFRQTAAQVANSLVSLQETVDRYRISKSIHEIAARDFELAKLRFEVGSVGSWDMIRSKNEFFNSLDSMVTLRINLAKQLALIERDYPPRDALGGTVPDPEAKP